MICYDELKHVCFFQAVGARARNQVHVWLHVKDTYHTRILFQVKFNIWIAAISGYYLKFKFEPLIISGHFDHFYTCIITKQVKVFPYKIFLFLGMTSVSIKLISQKKTIFCCFIIFILFSSSIFSNFCWVISFWIFILDEDMFCSYINWNEN